MVLRIEVNTDDASDYIQFVARRAIPEAEVTALNDLAAMSRRVIQGDLSNTFTTRNKWVERGILFQKATLFDLESTVFSRDKFMTKQETGGTETPRTKEFLAIPARVRTNRKKRITRAKRPKALLAKSDEYFKAFTRKGVHVIFRRFKNRNRLLEVQYILKKSTTYRPRWGFETKVEKTVRRFHKRFYERALRRSLK